MFDFIPLVAVICAAGGVFALVLEIRRAGSPERLPTELAPRAVNVTPSLRGVVTEAIDLLGVGLVGVITDMKPTVVESWAEGKGQPATADVGRLLAAHLSFKLVSSAEGSDDVARHWFMAGDSPFGDSPISLLRSDQLDEVVRSARLQAMQ